jgi:hypothetical protein
VYLADQTTDGVFELFLVSSGAKLSGPMAGSGVTSFALTPDKSAVVYIADQTTAGVFELYQVAISTPGVSVKLNGALTAGGDVTSFDVTPDGTSVVYRADQRFDQVFEVFRVLFTTPQASTLLNPAFLFGSGKSVTQFAVTPDSSKVVYIANQDTNNVNELYQVAFVNPQSSTKLNVPLAAPKNVTDFVIAPNSATVVYLADQNINGVFEIFPAPIGGPGSTTSLNTPLIAGQTVTTFAITPDNSAVVFLANNTPTGQFGVFWVTFANPQTSAVMLNGALTPGGKVSSFVIAPNGSAVVYSADQNIVGVVELFRVPITPVGGIPCPGPSPSCAAQKINPTFAAPQTVSAYAITPDSSAAVYLANQTAPTVVQVYRVPFSSLNTATPPLNGTLVAGGNVSSLAVSPDSTLVFYLADQTTFNVTELYAVNVGTPGSSSKLNGQLVTGGNVTAFAF